MTINKLADGNEYVSPEFKQFELKYHKAITKCNKKDIQISYSNHYYSWMYTKFINEFNVKDKCVLDQGTCRSIFPYILTELGANVQTIDVAFMEERLKMNKVFNSDIKHNKGDMRSMVMYGDETFDFITNMVAFCVVGPGDDYSGQHERAILQEAYRTLKPGGVYFMVTDYAREKSQINLRGKSGRIYDEDELNRLIIDQAENIGFKLYDEVDLTNRPYVVGGYTFIILCFRK